MPKYIIKKIIEAKTLQSALRKEKNTKPSEAYLAPLTPKLPPPALASAIGFEAIGIEEDEYYEESNNQNPSQK